VGVAVLGGWRVRVGVKNSLRMGVAKFETNYAAAMSQEAASVQHSIFYSSCIRDVHTDRRTVVNPDQKYIYFIW